MLSRRHAFQLHALVSDEDREHIFPVEFAYDYLPKVIRTISIPIVSFDNPFREQIEKSRGSNSILLYPTATGLPWHSGLRTLRQNKYWETNLKCTTDLLHLFAEDTKLDECHKANGEALAAFAKRELETRKYDRYSRFTTYMFPDATEARTVLLAQVILLIVIFDDTWEEAHIEDIKYIQEDFVNRLQSDLPATISGTPLQKRISQIRLGLLQEDVRKGNGGTDVLHELIEFCRHAPPFANFANVREYLDYRYKDVAMSFSYACAKFSLESDVDLHDAKLQRYLLLVGDHFSIANDIASYQKEYENYMNGKAKHLINVVAVVQELCGLEKSDDAKIIAYILQLYTEQAISEELEHMKRLNELTISQWEYVDAVLAMAAGNVFTSVVISRYGGESVAMKSSMRDFLIEV